MTDLSCFKAYDIRGKVPAPLSPELWPNILPPGAWSSATMPG